MNLPVASTTRYRPDIEGLRALAVVPVCLFHADLPVFSGGFVGVSVFFVISGYLMATLIGEGLERGDFSLADFYERRVRRIFPALFVVLFFCAVVAAFTVPPKLFSDFGATLAATVLFASNIIFMSKSANYFDASTEWNPLLHTWSLAVEEQFYMLFPLLLVLAWRFTWRTRFSIVALATFASLAVSIWGTANAPTATFYLLPTRAWEMLLGSLVALWAMRESNSVQLRAGSKWMADAGGLLGLSLVIGSLLWYDREMAFPGLSALAPTLGAALLIHFGRYRQSPAARLLSFSPMTLIGRFSYSLYLWHWPLIVFLDKYQPFGSLGPSYKGAVIVFSGLIAYVSLRWVEQPFRGKESKVTRRALYSIAAVIALALGGIGVAAQASNGWPERFPGFYAVSMAPQLANEHHWQEFTARGCFTTQASEWGKEKCFLGSQDKPNALLWGDSFAASYSSGLFFNERAKFNVLQYTSPRCPPIIGYEAASLPQCNHFNNQVAGIVKRHKITTVIMAANWHSYIKRRKMTYQDIGFTTEYLHKLGVRVILIGQSPIFTFVYPDEYFYGIYGPQQSEQKYFAPIAFDKNMNQSLIKIKNVDAFFDPLAVLCENSNCAFKRGKMYLFTDAGHYSQYGSKLVVNFLLNKVNDLQFSVQKIDQKLE